MLSYESYFLIMLISILGPVIGVVVLFFYHVSEKQMHFLEMQNKQILLEKELEVRRYLNLHQQIQPHFLFNVLNSLYSLHRLGKQEELSKSFEHIIIHLRTLFDKDKGPQCKISDEIAHTSNYLKIQKIRFRDRLQVHWNVDKEIEDCKIVRFLLQTLVENSFKHGFEEVERDFVLEITLQRKDATHLLLKVADNGPGFKKDPFHNPTGVGLPNIYKQLHFLYGDDAKISIKLNAEDEIGGEVTVVWPLEKA